MAVDVERRRPVLANVSGGLSGPSIRPLAVFMTWQVCQVVKVPVVGIGGIMSARDALEFLIAGATAVQVGTANFVHPMAAIDVVRGLETWLAERGIGSVRDVVGSLRPGVEAPR
jgi:dihydroorotate dehydrogenase (NAD+) catalytic subunit